MPAAVVKGILLSIAIIAALGMAVMESPHVQAWLDEQRRKVVQLLRTIGDELDPPSRRAAEAFAFEGRTPTNDEHIRREADASLEAAAVATGRSLSGPSTMRRLPTTGSADPSIAEERFRKGQEYLEQRKKTLQALRERSKNDPAPSNGSSSSFDDIVDSSGHLIHDSSTSMISASGTSTPVVVESTREMSQLERKLIESMLAGETYSFGTRAWQVEAETMNPFSDEHALERSITPKPPVPPKIALDHVSSPTIAPAASPKIIQGISTVPPLSGREDENQSIADERLDELSYEEQIAIALALSEQDTIKVKEVISDQHLEEDDQLRKAIANSLKDLNRQHKISSEPPSRGPLIDLTSSVDETAAVSTSDWSTIFAPQPMHRHTILQAPASETSDDLYRVTPRLTTAQLARHDEQNVIASRTTDNFAHAVLSESSTLHNDVAEASFYSAPSDLSRSSTPRTFGRGVDHHIIESETTPAGDALEHTALSTSPQTLAQSTSASRDHSRTRSDSSVELIHVAEDSDMDIVSEDGIATPDSWSEIGEGDAEMTDVEGEAV